MLKNPLLEKISGDRVALGMRINDPEMVELCAHLGFDWFMLDQMFTANDWGRTQDLIRTGEAAGLTPVVRVHSNPWLGYDHSIAVNVSRAHGIGAQFIMVSNSCKKEIEESLVVAKDWHAKALWIHPFKGLHDWAAKTDEMAQSTYIIPQPESLGALDDLEEILAMPEIKMLFMASTDASRVITGAKNPDWNHPKLWEYMNRIVELGRKNGVVIGANTSYAYTLKELQQRVRRLHEAGVRMIMIQGSAFFFQVAMTEFLDGLRDDLGLG